MKPETRTRILIVDDHLVVRVGIASLLRTQPDFAVVGQVGTGAEAGTLYRAEKPDIVLMDLRLPDLSGVDCTTAIRAFDREARIIILTTFEGDENVFRAIKAGAKAYLLKDVNHDELVATIRAVHRGDYTLPARLSSILTRRLTEAELSGRELDILRLIASGRANKEIGQELGISESTVKGHVNHILAKMHARDRTDAVTTALRQGLLE